MELHFLGTGAGLPSKHRNVTSVVLDLLAERGSCFMFDCGEATQHQVLHSHIKLTKVDRLFITHLHGDHIFGIPGLLSSRSFHSASAGRANALHVYGPKGLKEYIETCLRVSGSHLTYPVEVSEIGEEGGLAFEDETVKVYAHWLLHGVPCIGYRIEEKERPGEFFPDKAKALGLPPGPLYRKLQAGESVETPDGRRIHPAEVMGQGRKGRCVTILGDTRPNPRVLELAREADVLVHEATFRAKDSQLAINYNHSTTVEAAKAAAESHVRKLILTHISARYDTLEIKELEEEAKAVFPCVQIADDFMTVTVPWSD